MAKVNYALFHGTGFLPEEDEYKFQIAESMDKKFNVNIISYFKQDQLEKYKSKKTNFHWIYERKYWKENLSMDEMKKTERWLGTPFLLIARYVHKYSDRRYQENINNKKFQKEIYEYIAKHAYAWKKFFQKNKINAFTNYLEPKVVETTSNIVAHRMGILAVNLAGGRVTNSMVLHNSEWTPLFWKKTPKDKIKEYSEFFIKRYQKRGEPEAATLGKDFAQGKSILKTTKNIVREYSIYDDLHKQDSLRYATATDRVLRRIFDKRVRMIASKALYTTNFDLEKEEYFFFPLHFAEESTLSVKERFLDQYKLLEMISWSLPKDIKLVVKPHPHWHGSDIEIRKLMKLKENENIVVLPYWENPYKTIRNSIGAIIINSTTGMEAIALNKPLIVFGHDMYEGNGISLAIRDMKYIPNAISMCINDPEKTFDLDARKKLLAEYYNHVIFLDGKVGASLEITNKDCRKLAKEISECIKTKIKEKKN